MTDRELLNRFESATLSGSEFTHQEHVRLAWLYLRERSLHEVLDHFPRHPRLLAMVLGAPRLYHETVTWFFLMLVHDRIARGGETADWERFATRNPDLLERSSELLSRYYRPETWQSALARERFLVPDKSES